MDGYKDIKKSIQKISNKEIETDERRSVPDPRYYELKESQKDTGKKTGDHSRIKISEPQKNVPLQQIASVPKKSFRQKNEVLEGVRSIYNDEEMNLHLKAIGDAGHEVPKTPNDLSRIRAEKMDAVRHIDEKGIEKTEFVWKENIPQNVRQHYDWLREYYRYRDDTREEYRQISNAKLQDVPHKVAVNDTEKIYEHQKGLNCYCCAGTAMLNQFIKNDRKEEKAVRYFNQNDLRAYRPSVKKYNPDQEKQGLISPGQYRRVAGEIDKYAGRGTDEYGSVFEMGDFFIEKTGGKAILNKMYFQRPPKAENAMHNMLTVFKNKVNEVLSSGNVLGFLEVDGAYGHYLTITGINGNDITIQNSLNPEGRTREVKTVDQLFSRLIKTGNPVEMVWLSDMKQPKELTEEYSNLQYDEKKGYSLRMPNSEGVADISHTKGLAVKKELDDMGPGMESITEVAYIPNPLSKVETVSLDDALKTGMQDQNDISSEISEEEKSVILEKVTEKREYTEEELKEKEAIQKRIKSYYEDKEKTSIRMSTKEKKQRELDQLLRESKYDPKKKKQLRQAAEKRVRDYEKKNKDYATFGVAFNINNAKANDADSSLMRRVKNRLSEYLKIRGSIFEKYELKESGTEKLLDTVTGNERLIAKDLTNMVKLTDDDRNLFGAAYESLKEAADTYIHERSHFFKFGRGNARLKQVKKLKEQLQLDNIRFYLSGERRMLLNSVDEKYEKDNASLRQRLMPTWKRFISVKDELNLKNQLYREKRSTQKENGTLPSASTRIGEWSYRALENTWLRTKIVYNGIGGTIDRTIGAATMLAANTLELGGKVVKAPLKLLSMMFNGFSSLFGSKARWRMKYSLGEGWKGIDDGRKIFRRYLKGACLLPAFVTESLTRGVPYIFGHNFKSGVYKRTKRWGKAILDDIKKVGHSLGIKDYGAMDRGDAEYGEIPGHMEENGEYIKYNADGGWGDEHSNVDYEDSDSVWEDEYSENEEISEKASEENKSPAVHSDWTYGKNKVTVSTFKERTLPDDKYLEKASPEQIDKMLGEDKLLKSVNETLKMQNDGRNMNRDGLKDMIKETYRLLKGKDAGEKEIAGRTDEAMDKQRLSRHLTEELMLLSNRRSSDRKAIEAITPASIAERSAGEYKTEEEKEALNLWAFGKDGQPDYFNIKRFNDGMGGADTYSGPLRTLRDIKIEDFIDRNEADAASGFAARYETVCRMAAGDVILDKYEAYNRQWLEGYIDLPIGEMRGKVAFFKELKAQYENRFKLMTSPWFALCKKEDLKKYLEKGGEKKANDIKDESLRDFVLLYIRTMTSPLAIGKDFRKYYEGKLKDAKTKQAGQDEARSAELYATIQKFDKNPVSIDKQSMLFPEIEEKGLEAEANELEAEKELRQMYLAKKADIKHELGRFPGNSGFIDKYSSFGDIRIMGLSRDEQYELERFMVSRLYIEGQINGKAVAPEHLKVIGDAVDKCMKVRREFLAISESVSFINFLCNGAGCDMNSDQFTKTAAGKRLKKCYLEYGLPDKYKTMEMEISREYIKSFTEVFALIHDLGYTFSEKYEKRIRTDGDKVIEAERKKYEDRLNTGRKEGEEVKSWDYPSVTVNGRQFKLYIYDADDGTPLKKLMDGNFNVDEDKKDQLFEQLDELSETLKTRRVAENLYAGEVGMKALVFSAYSTSCDRKCLGLLENIRKTLNL